jgi:hypothetical protein
MSRDHAEHLRTVVRKLLPRGLSNSRTPTEHFERDGLGDMPPKGIDPPKVVWGEQQVTDLVYVLDGQIVWLQQLAEVPAAQRDQFRSELAQTMLEHRQGVVADLSELRTEAELVEEDVRKLQGQRAVLVTVQREHTQELATLRERTRWLVIWATVASCLAVGTSLIAFLLWLF